MRNVRCYVAAAIAASLSFAPAASPVSLFASPAKSLFSAASPVKAGHVELTFRSGLQPIACEELVHSLRLRRRSIVRDAGLRRHDAVADSFPTRALSAGAACLLVVCVMASAWIQPAAAQKLEFSETNWSMAPDLAATMPKFDESELNRRRTASASEVKDETWFKRGRLAFSSRCIGCHTMDPTKPEKKLITGEVLKESAYIDPKRMQFIIRYGMKGMPGYAMDCADLGEPKLCNVAVPLDENSLQDVEDYVFNQANNGWLPIVSKK